MSGVLTLCAIAHYRVALFMFIIKIYYVFELEFWNMLKNDEWLKNNLLVCFLHISFGSFLFVPPQYIIHPCFQ